MIAVQVSIKKHEGDDVYSWAVFVNGVVVSGLTGLSRQQERFYRVQIERDNGKRITRN